VGAACETFVRVDHQVAGETELVVVLDIIVHAVAVNNRASEQHKERDRDYRKRGFGQPAQPTPESF